MKKQKLHERIRQIYDDGERSYHALMLAVFPPEECPRAWNYKTGGGPPGCVMVFGAALRRAGLRRTVDGSRVEAFRVNQ